MSKYFDEEEFERSMSTRTLLRIVKLSGKHWWLALGSLGGILIVSVIEAYFTFMTARIIDEGVIPRDAETLTTLAWQYLLWWIPFAVMVFVFIICTGSLGHYVKRDMRRTMFDHLQKLELAYYDRTPTGWLQARVTSDVERIGDLVAWGFLDMTWAFGAITTSLVFMFIINWQLALVIMLIVPIIALTANWFQIRILDAFRDSRKTNSKITGALVEENITLPIQINGKRRDEISVPADMPKDEIEKLVLVNEAVQRALNGGSPKKWPRGRKGRSQTQGLLWSQRFWQQGSKGRTWRRPP